MKEKELMNFVKDLHGRGLLSVSPDEFDYEKVIWEHLTSVNLMELTWGKALCREVEQGVNDYCDRCGSTLTRKGFFGRKHCRNKLCKNN